LPDCSENRANDATSNGLGRNRTPSNSSGAGTEHELLSSPDGTA
jgi:hypothetical protein